jgi:hypothetical protein
MSQENVELVKRLYDAWEKDGFGVGTAVMDPDIEYVNPPYAVEPGTRPGYEEFAIAAPDRGSARPVRPMFALWLAPGALKRRNRRVDGGLRAVPLASSVYRCRS